MAGLIVLFPVAFGGIAGLCTSSALSTLKIFTDFYDVSTMFRLGVALGPSIVGLAIIPSLKGGRDVITPKFLLSLALISFGLGSFSSVAITSTLYLISPLVRNSAAYIGSSGDYFVAPVLTFFAISSLSLSCATFLGGTLLRALFK